MAINVQNMSILLDDEDQQVVFVGVWLSLADIRDLLSRFDPNSNTSPSTADARPITKAILNKALEVGITS
jgi:hypothetical protein